MENVGSSRCDIPAVDHKLDFFKKYDICYNFWLLFPAYAGSEYLYAEMQIDFFF